MPRVALEPGEYPFFDYRRFTFSLGIVAGGSAWLSGSTAVRFDKTRGGMVVDGDLVAQARVIIEKMRCTLAAGGLGLGDIVRVVEYVTPAALPALQRLADLRAEVWGSRQPSVGTVVVKSLLRPEASIEIEAVASGDRAGGLVYAGASGADERQAWTAAEDSLRVRGLIRSDVVRSTMLVVPGQRDTAGEDVGLRIAMPRLVDEYARVQLEIAAAHGRKVIAVTAQGDPAAGDVVGQTREAYSRIACQLIEAGASLDAVVKTTEFITPAALTDYRRTGDVRREVFAAPYPAATGVVCERLADPASRIAIEAIAVTPGGVE